jgi:hypothetical protein
VLIIKDFQNQMAQANEGKGKRDQGSALNEEARQMPARNEEKQSSTSKRRKIAGENQSDSSGRYQGSSGRTREDEDLKSISSQAGNPDEDLHTLQQEEISGSSEPDLKSVNYSDTDEDEDEGLGDGNLGRSVRGDSE